MQLKFGGMLKAGTNQVGLRRNLVLMKSTQFAFIRRPSFRQLARNRAFRMDFEQLKTFQQVCRLKSFSRAAEKLGVTQPAISAQIRSLEKEVGARLFDRDGGKVTFTAAGTAF